MKNDIVKFIDNGLELEVNISPDEDTVWLTQAQMVELFERDQSVIARHIRNIFKDGELDEKSNMQFLHIANSDKPIKLYNLDVIISVGYRVKSPRGIVFRKWATNILRQYLKEGYAINEKRLEILNKTIQIQSRIIASIEGLEESEVLKVVQQYSRSLELLDSYDHQSITTPSGRQDSYRIQYDECMDIIKNMEFSQSSDVFGVEKEQGKLQGILAAIYQSVFGQDAYPTLEEKAANLLYFLVKDHPFNDGCKRIAAALFVYFLNKNNILYKGNRKIISDSALVAITLMVAESRPEEKNIMVSIIINFLHWE